ncbi:hypothetical protein MBLNU459_g2808t1 [Dothideomycetes sp. NU459]
MGALFQWLEDRPPDLQAISFVDDIGLVIECDELEDGATQLERIARDTMQWGSDNKVEFEVSKTEVLLFSRRKKVLQAATNVVVNIGEQLSAIKQDATKWLGFWLDSKLSFKTHFENRMTSAKGALQRVASLSRSNGGLSINLMRKVVVAAVTSTLRLGSLVERPTGPGEQIAAVAEQPSQSHHRTAEIDASNLFSKSSVLTLRK